MNERCRPWMHRSGAVRLESVEPGRFGVERADGPAIGSADSAGMGESAPPTRELCAISPLSTGRIAVFTLCESGASSHSDNVIGTEGSSLLRDEGTQGTDLRRQAMRRVFGPKSDQPVRGAGRVGFPVAALDQVFGPGREREGANPRRAEEHRTAFALRKAGSDRKASGSLADSATIKD